MRLDHAELRALADKYREIEQLRMQQAAGEREPPRERLRALAARFPGALRELDERTLEDIQARLHALHAALAGQAPAPEWASLQIAYHALMRAVLRIKRLAAGRPAEAADQVLCELADTYRPAPFEPPLASFDRAAIEAILEPAGGRLNPWVFTRVAAAAGVEPDAVRRALFVR